MNKAKKVATELPGGELLVEEQDEIIELLEKIRDKKRSGHQIRLSKYRFSETCRQQLAVFSQQVVTPTSRFLAMDVDSTASTPS